MSNFYRYFKENMDALNPHCRETIYGTPQAATGQATVLLSLIQKLGAKTTSRELIGAGTTLKYLMVIGGMQAAYYVGAVIGSIAVATGRTLAGGTSLSDVLLAAQEHNLNRPWLLPVLQNHPRIYNRRLTDRNSYSARTALA
jgi:hypothetical protein